MKLGKVRQYVVPAGINKGRTCWCRRIWMRLGERQPSLIDMDELEGALQDQHPNDLVSVDTGVSAFSNTAATLALNETDEAPAPTA